LVALSLLQAGIGVRTVRPLPAQLQSKRHLIQVGTVSPDPGPLLSVAEVQSTNLPIAP
jgi:hypothetical protein